MFVFTNKFVHLKGGGAGYGCTVDLIIRNNIEFSVQRSMSDMETGQGERRNSGFLVKLERAHQKINTLEDFIRDRERQFHVAVNRMRLERRDSRQGVGRLRRVGHADVLLRMRSSSIGREESDEDLGKFV